MTDLIAKIAHQVVAEGAWEEAGLQGDGPIERVIDGAIRRYVAAAATTEPVPDWPPQRLVRHGRFEVRSETSLVDAIAQALAVERAAVAATENKFQLMLAELEATCERLQAAGTKALTELEAKYRPGMTDMMVPPETLDTYMAENPLPLDHATIWEQYFDRNKGAKDANDSIL